MKKNIPVLIVALLVLCASFTFVYSAAKVQPSTKFTIARLKYSGGGDWYGNPSSLPNLLKFLKKNTNIDVAERETNVSIADEELFSYPFVYMNGHGNVSFSPEEVARLRTYLDHGGFLHADDNFGMDPSFRREIKKVFPENDLVEIPFDYGIFHCHFDFSKGLPKIHEHAGGPPHALGIFRNGRLVVFYSFNTDLGDGWEDPDVHKDPPEIREAALKMGVNIIVWALTH